MSIRLGVVVIAVVGFGFRLSVFGFVFWRVGRRRVRSGP